MKKMLTVPCLVELLQTSTFGTNPFQLPICRLGLHAGICTIHFDYSFYAKNIFLRKMNKGNIVNWDRAQWNFTNAELGKRTQEEVCKLPDPRDVAFPERRTYEKHNLLCKAINGKVTVITSEDFQARFTDMFLSTIPKSILSSSLTFLQVWAGWDDVTKEGDWWNINTGDSMSNSLLLWSPGEPNGERLENCATLWVARGVWNDAPCDYPFYGSCFIEARPRMNLRGRKN